ncbi:hypothetical protein, partial [Nonomuraea mesophila]|uniref:hypothetical protein n=1 Tax=Nonomuraea mesophila TaxID=2530382 RepID=UPI001C703D17
MAATHAASAAGAPGRCDDLTDGVEVDRIGPLQSGQGFGDDPAEVAVDALQFGGDVLVRAGVA